jgi:hypothetical protein
VITGMKRLIRTVRICGIGADLQVREVRAHQGQTR